MIETTLKDSIAHIQLNAPSTLNALTLSMGQQVESLLTTYEKDPNVKVVVLESLVDKAFSVGIDLKEFNANNTEHYRQQFLDSWNSASNFPKPIIVKLNGYVMGGGLELALMGDILIADETCQFSQPELSVGTIPGMGATQRLPRTIGPYQTNYLVLTSESFTAQTVYEWGLISRITTTDQLDSLTQSIANSLSQKSLPTLIAAKKALKTAQETPLSKGLQIEKELFLNTFDLDDQSEGFQAFIDKRPPNFSDT